MRSHVGLESGEAQARNLRGRPERTGTPRVCPEQIAYFEQMAPGEKVRLSGSLLGGILEGIRKEFTPFCSDPDFQHRAFERLHGGVRPDLSLLLFSLEKQLKVPQKLLAFSLSPPMLCRLNSRARSSAPQ